MHFFLNVHVEKNRIFRLFFIFHSFLQAVQDFIDWKPLSNRSDSGENNGNTKLVSFVAQILFHRILTLCKAMYIMKPSLYIVEPRRFDQDIHRRELESRNCFNEIRVCHSIHEAMESLRQKSRRGRPLGSASAGTLTYDCVCLVGQTVLKLLNMLEEAVRYRVRARFFLVCGRQAYRTWVRLLSRHLSGERQLQTNF